MAKKSRSSASGSRKTVSKTLVIRVPLQKRQVSIGRERRAWAVMTRSMRTAARPLNGTDGPCARYPDSTSAGASDDADDLGCLAPQPLEAVDLAPIRSEDVDDHRSEVEQHPSGRLTALAAQRADALSPPLVDDGAGQRLDLAIAAAGADDEEVGHGR